LGFCSSFLFKVYPLPFWPGLTLIGNNHRNDVHFESICTRLFFGTFLFICWILIQGIRFITWNKSWDMSVVSCSEEETITGDRRTKWDRWIQKGDEIQQILFSENMFFFFFFCSTVGWTQGLPSL
jgi:hypothetical protein